MMSSKNIETRERILRAAWQLLEADEGSGVRMADIAKEAGISRQAVYLHFPARAELLIATTRYLDKVKGIEERLNASREATRGVDRLNAFIEAWGNYIPEIYGVAKALLVMKDSDEAAALAWADRMQAVRQGCEAAVKALKKDHVLSTDYSLKTATDVLWMLLSVRNWEHLTGECGLPQKQYIETVKMLANRAILARN